MSKSWAGWPFHTAWACLWIVVLLADHHVFGGAAAALGSTALVMRFAPRPEPAAPTVDNAGWFTRTVEPAPRTGWVVQWTLVALVALTGCAWGWTSLMVALDPSTQDSGFLVGQPWAWAVSLVVLAVSLVLAEWALRRRPWAVPRNDLPASSP